MRTPGGVIDAAGGRQRGRVNNQEEKPMADLQEQLRVANLSIDTLSEERQKDEAYYRGELDKQTKEKAAAVLACADAQTLLTEAHACMAAFKGKIQSLKAELNSMKAQRDRAQGESKRLQRKVVSLQGKVNGLDVDDEEVVTNHFDQNEHYREM